MYLVCMNLLQCKWYSTVMPNTCTVNKQYIHCHGYSNFIIVGKVYSTCSLKEKGISYIM